MKEKDIYRRVYQRLWRHKNFKSLEDGEKVLALYLVTGPQTNLIGCYRFSPALAAEDLGIPQMELLHKRLKVVLAAFEWTFDVEGDQLLWIKSWLKWNPPNGANSRTAWRKAIEEVPSEEVKRCLLDGIGMPSQPAA